MKLVDITVPLHPDLPLWPGSPGLRIRSLQSRERGDPVNASQLEMDVHVGTHVDAPSHFLPGGRTAETLDLESLVGPAWVADLGEATVVTRDLLETSGIPPGTKRLLLKSRNSGYWQAGSSTFRSDYTALLSDAAEWVVERGVGLLGVDYLSVQRQEDGPEVHEILLRSDVILLEGLNLTAAEAGQWELLCLPLPLVGSEGAPARAVLRREETS